MARLSHSLTILGGLALGCANAAAADLPSPAPPPPPPPSTSAWTGPWIGLYGGAAFADPGGVFSITSSSQFAYPPVVPALDASGTGGISARGATFGLEAGWNQKIDQNIIIGIEGDFGFYDLQGRRSASGVVPLFGVDYGFAQSLRINWESALRLRVGYHPSNLALAYVEAGPALANIRYVSNFWDAVDETESVSLQSVKLGLSVGAGVEYAVAKNISVKAEYLYSHFPSLTGTGASLLTDGTTTYIAHSSGAIDQSVLRVGLTYYLQ